MRTIEAVNGQRIRVTCGYHRVQATVESVYYQGGSWKAYVRYAGDSRNVSVFLEGCYEPA